MEGRRIGGVRVLVAAGWRRGVSLDCLEHHQILVATSNVTRWERFRSESLNPAVLPWPRDCDLSIDARVRVVPPRLLILSNLDVDLEYCIAVLKLY